MLQSVLNRGNLGMIRNTVKRLPLSVIVPLVKELSNRVGGIALSELFRLILWYYTIRAIQAYAVVLHYQSYSGLMLWYYTIRVIKAYAVVLHYQSY